MVDTGIFATTAEVQRKAGAGVSSTANTEAYINQFMTEAESYINAYCNYNYSDAYPTLNVDKKGLLKEAASNIAAGYVINFDTDGIVTAKAQTRINFLWARADKILEILKQGSTNTFVQNP